MDLAERNTKVFNIGINRATADRKGIQDGDAIGLETADGKKAKGIARLTEGIHPECLSVPGILFGRWSVGNRKGQGNGVHFNSLMTYNFERMDTVAAALDACIKVRIRKA